MSNESTVARIQTARENEQLVLAEAALTGQRFVSWIRLVVLGLQGVSQLGVRELAEHPLPFDASRFVAIALYATWTVGVIVVLRRSKASIRGAQFWPLVFTLVDFAFIDFMAYRTIVASPALATMTAPMGVVAYGVLLTYSIAAYRWSQALVGTALAIGSYLAFSLHSGSYNIGISSFIVGCFVGLGVLVGASGSFVRRMFVDLRKRDNLTRFLPKQVAARVLELGDGALAPTQREVTVLFSDIRDFTRFAEPLPPRVVLEFLDEYFAHMSQIVKGREGVVNKFLGDGLLAVWGVPDLDDQHAEHAVQAALDMLQKVEELNTYRVRDGAAPIRIGVGIHTGLVAAGMLGGAEQHEYTIIGDAVNLASRIEGLTKEVGAPLLISESTWEKVQGRFQVRAVDARQVKGRDRPVGLYVVEGRAVEGERATQETLADETTSRVAGTK